MEALDAYAGTFWNAIHTVKIVVTIEMHKLYYSVPGLESENFVLDYYNDNVYTWIRPRIELVARGRWVDHGAEYWKSDLVQMRMRYFAG